VLNQSRRSKFHQARYRQTRGSSEGAGIWTEAALPIDAAIEALETAWEAYAADACRARLELLRKESLELVSQ
jgi:hypothetical protein